MSGQPWYRHNPRDFLDGIVGMGPDLIGAYIVTLDLIYARGGPIPFDQRWIGGVMGCSPRAATALVNRLVETGKLHLDDGKLSNDRAEIELENAAKFSRNQAESGAKGGRITVENRAAKAKNNDLEQASLKPQDNKTEDKKEQESANALSARAVEDDLVSFWNEMATTTGLSRVVKLNPQRRAMLKARIAEHGRDQFTEAIAKIGASPFCTGQTGDFRASFDFLLKPSSFLKVIEGNYDARRNGPVGNTRQAGQPRPGTVGWNASKALIERALATEQAENQRGGGEADWGTQHPVLSLARC